MNAWNSVWFAVCGSQRVNPNMWCDLRIFHFDWAVCELSSSTTLRSNSQPYTQDIQDKLPAKLRVMFVEKQNQTKYCSLHQNNRHYSLFSVSLLFVCTLQGHIVAKGTYTELQQSGVDFTSLLKEEEEEQQPPQDIPARSRTLSQNSLLSQTSSVHSVKDGDHLPVRKSFPLRLSYKQKVSEQLPCVQKVLVW